MKTDPLQTEKCLWTQKTSGKKLSYKIIIDSKNEISLPNFYIYLEPTKSTLKIRVMSGNVQTFPLPPKKNDIPGQPIQTTSATTDRLFQGTHRLQHHGLPEQKCFWCFLMRWLGQSTYGLQPVFLTHPSWALGNGKFLKLNTKRL